jgi:hypothetical protein
MSPIDRFLARLGRVSARASGWTACCPAHEDAHPSLSIGLGIDDRVLVRCWAGCCATDIVKAVGLHMKDLFPERTRRAGR